MQIGVTGHTGFVGSRFVELPFDGGSKRVLDLRKQKPVEMDLGGLDCIVHFAGKAHEMKEIDPSVYFSVNVDLSHALAEKAKAAGVKHFIYISSTKVYGDFPGGPLHEASPCEPGDPYGQSKLKAEQVLKSMESGTFSVGIVRPPLVYGPGVKGNLIRLLELSAKNYPLPLGNINNRRTLVGRDNLIALVHTIIERKASGVFLAGDGNSVSTTELVTMIREDMGKQAGLISIPGIVRQAIRKFAPSVHARLFGSFELDTSHTNAVLGFRPPVGQTDGIEQMVHWFLKNRLS